MRATAVLCLGWAALALFLLWLSYQPLPLTIYWIDPAEAARWEACKALHDPWTGDP